MFKKSRYISYLFSLLLLVLGGMQTTKAAQSPEFIKTKNWKIQKVSGSKIILSCKAVFYNPNKARAKLMGVNFKFLLGETKAGKVDQITKKIKIKKKQAFEIPLRIVISPETNAWGKMKGILSAFTLQDFVVHVRGFIEVRVFGVRLKIPVDETEQLNLKNVFRS